MGLKRKIRTLLDPEKRLAASYETQRTKAAERRTFPLTPEGFFRDIDPAKLNDIRARHAIENPGIRVQKYLEFEKWFPVNIRRILDIGLDFRPSSRILDLGSGAGYFLHISKQLGHQVLGLDLHDPCAPWYGELFDLFGIKRVIWRIQPFVPLPDLGPRFDIVTAFMVCFNDHLGEHPWGVKEWTFFLDDLKTRTNPNPLIWFQLNPMADGTHTTPELAAFFESRGAIIDGKRVIWGLTPLEYRVLQQAARRTAKSLRIAEAAPDPALSA